VGITITEGFPLLLSSWGSVLDFLYMEFITKAQLFVREIERSGIPSSDSFIMWIALFATLLLVFWKWITGDLEIEKWNTRHPYAQEFLFIFLSISTISLIFFIGAYLYGTVGSYV